MLTKLLSVRADLIAETADMLVPEGRNYSRNIIVFPGKRPAHFLRREIGRRTGAGFIPPRIFSMDSFVDELCSASSPCKKVDALEAVALLYEIHLSLEKRLGRENFSSLDQFYPIGLQLYRDLEEMAIEYVGSEQLRRLNLSAEVEIPDSSRDRIINIALYYERFYELLRKREGLTRSMRYCTAAGLDLPEWLQCGNTVLFAGFFAFTAAETGLMKSVSALRQACMLLHDGPGIDALLKDIGVDIQRRDSETAEPSVELLACPDVHGEACSLADMLHTMDIGEGLDETTAVILPSSESLFPVVRHALAGLDDKGYNVSIGYPLGRTPIFGFFKALNDVVSSSDGNLVYTALYTAFMLHPYTKNIYFGDNSEITRILLHCVEDSLKGEITPSFISLADVESDSGMLQKAAAGLSSEGYDVAPAELCEHLKNIHNRTLTPFAKIESVADFASKCRVLLEYLHDSSTARLHPLFMPYATTAVKALETVSASSLGRHRFSDASGYFSFLERFMATLTVPFDGTPLQGLQVLGLLETRALHFRRVFILDANEDVLPEARKKDSFIPAAAREMLGLPTFRDRELMARYYFTCLVNSAEHVKIMFVESDRKQKSRFVEELLWRTEQGRGSLTRKDEIRRIRYAVNLINRAPAGIVKSDTVMHCIESYQFSPTALDRYLECPLRFYYRDMLGLKPRSDNRAEIERNDVGLIVHEALRRLFAGLGGRRIAGSAVSDKLIGAIVNDIFAKRFGGQPFGRAYIVMKQIIRRLSEFADSWLIPLADLKELSVVLLEGDMSMQFNGLQLKGRPDAVLMIDGIHTVVDFKTSADRKRFAIAFDRLDPEERSGWRTAVGSLQLPVYRMLYAERAGADIDSLNAMYLMLGGAAIDSSIEAPLFDPKYDRSLCSDKLSRLLAALLDEIKNRDIPFGPASDLKVSCPLCDYSSLCGTQWVSGNR